MKDARKGMQNIVKDMGIVDTKCGKLKRHKEFFWSLVSLNSHSKLWTPDALSEKIRKIANFILKWTREARFFEPNNCPDMFGKLKVLCIQKDWTMMNYYFRMAGNNHAQQYHPFNKVKYLFFKRAKPNFMFIPFKLHSESLVVPIQIRI